MATRYVFLLLAGVIAAAGRQMPDFALTDTGGHLHARAEWKGKRAIVLLFVTTDCPLSNGYVPEMNRIDSAYEPRGVAFYAVQGDATVPLEAVREHVKEFVYNFPYLLDPEETLATFAGATTTPEAAVFSPAGALLYLGRIDNRLEDFGKQRVQITEFDLRDALDAILAGKPVARPRTKAMGCAITRKN
jgi:peroxiredoxin